MRGWRSYVVAVVGYIALSWLTKRFLTWTWGPFYFIFWLEIVPRTFRRLRRLPPSPSTYTPVSVVVEGGS